jgi:hypothetical protein
METWRFWALLVTCSAAAGTGVGMFIRWLTN